MIFVSVGLTATFRISLPDLSGRVTVLSNATVWFDAKVMTDQKHYLSQCFALSFAMLVCLVYLTYCNVCDRL